MPLESEFVKWRDDVVVPCGKPVDSKVRASELMYNEYIVYNTAQVSVSTPDAFLVLQFNLMDSFLHITIVIDTLMLCFSM